MAKKQNYLGIDLGGSSMKVVELKNANNRPQLVTYGFVDETPNIVKEDSPAAQKELLIFLQHLLKKTKASTNLAITALPSFSVFSSIITLPMMNKKDLISAVRWEAKKFVPIPLEEMILDWEVLSEEGQTMSRQSKETEVSGKIEKEKDNKTPKTGKGNIKVLLTAAPKNLVNRYVSLFKEAELQIVGLETESFALERALVGNDKNPIMTIDIGGGSTSIIIYSNGVPILNRSIDVGGKTVTTSMERILGTAGKESEQFKKDLSLSLMDEDFNKLPEPVSYLVNSVINEVRYILNIYKSQNKQPIARVILTGGSASLFNLAGYLENIFQIKSYVGDPWARVVHPVEIDSLLKQLGPRLSVAIGLAMREIVK